MKADLARPAGLPVLESRGLHRFYRRGDDEVAALRDVSFEVFPGEIVAITGPSGSGKSTLLGLLAGLDNPDGGSVWIAGQRFSHGSPAQQARMRGERIGILTQASGLVEHLTVLQNVKLAASFRGGRRLRALATRSVPAPHPSPQTLLDELGMRHRERGRPSTLSGGETARANLAVALAGQPLILLADEPTAEVSRDEETRILALLRATRPAGGATVLVTHSAVVADSADRVLFMTDGKLR